MHFINYMYLLFFLFLACVRKFSSCQDCSKVSSSTYQTFARYELKREVIEKESPTLYRYDWSLRKGANPEDLQYIFKKKSGFCAFQPVIKCGTRCSKLNWNNSIEFQFVVNSVKYKPDYLHSSYVDLDVEINQIFRQEENRIDKVLLKETVEMMLLEMSAAIFPVKKMVEFHDIINPYEELWDSMTSMTKQKRISFHLVIRKFFQADDSTFAPTARWKQKTIENVESGMIVEVTCDILSSSIIDKDSLQTYVEIDALNVGLMNMKDAIKEGMYRSILIEGEVIDEEVTAGGVNYGNIVGDATVTMRIFAFQYAHNTEYTCRVSDSNNHVATDILTISTSETFNSDLAFPTLYLEPSLYYYSVLPMKLENATEDIGNRSLAICQEEGASPVIEKELDELVTQLTAGHSGILLALLQSNKGGNHYIYLSEDNTPLCATSNYGAVPSLKNSLDGLTGLTCDLDEVVGLLCKYLMGHLYRLELEDNCVYQDLHTGFEVTMKPAIVGEAEQKLLCLGQDDAGNDVSGAMAVLPVYNGVSKNTSRSLITMIHFLAQLSFVANIAVLLNMSLKQQLLSTFLLKYLSSTLLTQ